MAVLNRPVPIDKLSSQLDVKTNISDGGYGWIILVASIFYKCFIPSISVSYGILLMVRRFESDLLQKPSIWDTHIVYTALFFSATWTLFGPMCKVLNSTHVWPRLISVSGTCMVSAGFLILCFTLTPLHANKLTLYITSGILTGAGSSLILDQIDVIIPQYFNLKLKSITATLNLASAIGFIIVPLVLGHYLLRVGTLHAIVWYQAILLQGFIVSIALKKPRHVKQASRNYNLISGLADDEEDIFAKTTELQSPRTNSLTTISLAEELATANLQRSRSEVIIHKNVQENQPVNLEVKKANWEKFDDDTDVATAPTKTHLTLHQSFANDFNRDLDRIDKFENNDNPRPLFNQTSVNNNTTYSYEIPNDIDDPVVFEPVKSNNRKCWKSLLDLIKKPSIYKIIIFNITTKLSTFMFWTFYPTYLFTKINSLNLSIVINITSCVALSGLLFTAINCCLKIKPRTEAIYLCICGWIAAIGFLMISDADKEITCVVGALLVCFSLNAMKSFGFCLLKIGGQEELTSHHNFICVLTGIALLSFLLLDGTYENWFRFTAIINFLTGSIWFSNFVYKKIKKQLE